MFTFLLRSFKVRRNVFFSHLLLSYAHFIFICLCACLVNYFIFCVFQTFYCVFLQSVCVQRDNFCPETIKTVTVRSHHFRSVQPFLVLVLLCCAVLLSVLGNGLVLVICSRRRKKMVGSELLCVNLAVVDFLCCICFYPLSILSSFNHAWLGENITCVYYGLGCYIFGLCGMFTITAISIIRYLKTCYSLGYGEGSRCY